MANISDVKLELFPQINRAHVSYKVTATNHDAEHQQAYSELIELVGVDEGPHEDGQNDRLISQEFRTVFDTSHVGFTQIREFDLSQVSLDEDPGPFRSDEIRARVTLTPEPAGPISRDSNLIQLFVNAQI